ncbi:hypothetical protein [Sedimentimonas flavescens]|uniref:hypothetical protein n=1 Tax=Sedimentimonas flavescens TaxID=2851012 RepID=UPI0021A41F62|nr:hypothetical protein [Sedimentimonas flavescens]MCT2541235.1 hypothetical protein [Sedimentimonas flavescens]
MKLVIHVGPPKTGTTALQRALFGARTQLIEKGILYPDPKVRKAYNHGLLCSLFRAYTEAPRGMRKHGEANYIRQGEGLSNEVRKQVKQRAPKLLILSSEWFARLYEANDPTKFMSFVESLGADSIDFVLYARRPSDFFLSASQQRLRAASIFEPIYPWNLDKLIAGFEALASKHRVIVRPFDRKAMTGGSIMSDFAALYFPEAAELMTVPQTSRQSNESFSPETMVILQDFRRAFFPDQEDVFNERTRKLMRRLQKLDASDGNPRPALLPEWKAYLDYGHNGALELRDRYGISFSDFDYQRLERGEFATRPEMGSDVADVVRVDAERLQRMIVSLEQSFWSPRRSSAGWLRDIAKRVGCAENRPRPPWRFA